MRILPLFLIASIYTSAQSPTRSLGVSVHFLPNRVAEIQGQSGGFVEAKTKTVYSKPDELIYYVKSLPKEIQKNGIWIVFTNPSAYSEKELAKIDQLALLCKASGIPAFKCRASELPDGWTSIP